MRAFASTSNVSDGVSGGPGQKGRGLRTGTVQVTGQPLPDVVGNDLIEVRVKYLVLVSGVRVRH